MATLILCIYIALLALTVATARSHQRVPRPPAWLQRLIHDRWPRSEWGRAACIAWHESRYQPRAYFAGNYGLWQINRTTWDPGLNPAAARVVGRVDWSRIYEPRVNADVAARIWRHSGWQPWATRGWC
jgi:hypothetical protein